MVGCGGLEGAPNAPTFAQDVAPILHEKCSACHRPGGPAPFDLLTYEDARTQALQILGAIEEGRMPPWLPIPGDVEFEGDRSLEGEEREILRAWFDGGMRSGELTDMALPSFEDGWALGAPDRTIRTTRSFPVPATGEDIFRNLVIPVPLSERVWVRGIEIRFTDASVVHHAMVTLDQTSSSRRMAGLDTLPGYDGMFFATEAIGPSGFLLGWTPGKEPALSPQDLAFALDPGTDLVLQLHIRPRGDARDVGAEIGLHFSAGAPSRTPLTLRLGAEELDIPPGEASYTEEDSYLLPVDIEMLGVYPHAHYLGKQVSLEAVLPDSTRLTVLEIPEWDFNWQDAYRFEAPLSLPAGTRLDARFVYDNSESNPHNPTRPPERVIYGPRSTDEMGEIWMQVVPGSGADLPTLVADFGEKDLASKVEGWRHMLAMKPGEPTAHVGLGTVDQSNGRHQEAVRHFEEAIDSRPGYVVAHYNMGVSLEQLGRVDEAVRHFETVARLDAGHASAHTNLGVIAAERGELQRAVAHFEAAVHGNPNHPEGLNNLGNALRQMGALSRAATHLERALDLEPRYVAARFNLALVAWGLATASDGSTRDGDVAVRLAERVVEGHAADYRLLDVLAAAYAEAGRYEEAVAAASRAVRLAEVRGDSSRAELSGLGFRLRLYSQNRPFRAR